ncbi:MAG: AMP-binding protein, partial [Mycobacteriales bacterium]
MNEQFNLALVSEVITAAIPDREVMVWRDRRLTYGQLGDRSRRLASYLHGRGLGARTPRAQLAGHESGQDHVALFMHNGNEYLESMLGCFKSRTVPVNVNYRYVAEELQYLFLNSRSRAVIYHGCFADRVDELRSELDVLIQVDDGSGTPLLPGAVDYETVLAESPSVLPDIGHSPDDLYLLYT